MALATPELAPDGRPKVASQPVDCPSCRNKTRVTNSRPIARERAAVKRTHQCEHCGIRFETEERTRLWVVADGRREPLLRGLLLASLRRAAGGCRPPIAADKLEEVVRSVFGTSAAAGELEQTPESLRRRTGEALLAAGLEQAAYKYDPALDPVGFEVVKRDGEIVAFDRAKLMGSIAAAAWKLLDGDKVVAVIAEVEDAIGETSDTLHASTIRELAGQALGRHDPRALIRYEAGASEAGPMLDHLYERLAPAARVRKRDGTVVVFEADKFAKSLHRSFAAKQRDERSPEIAEYVAEELARVRRRLAIHGEAETTAEIGMRARVWLYARDERAWMNYHLAFAGQSGGEAASTAEQLVEESARMRRLMGGRSGHQDQTRDARGARPSGSGSKA